MQRKTRRWILPETQPDQAGSTAAPDGLHPLLRRIMLQRGLAPERFDCFLNPSLNDLIDPLRMKGMAEAVARLRRAVVEHEPLAVYGDYDVDGLTATAALSSFLRELDVPLITYIPNRLSEGYGLNAQALERIAGQGVRLVVTVDCGMAALEEAERAAELGLELIITDHHQPGARLPRAVSVVNPNQPGCEFPDKGLAGVGIAFYLLMALKRELRDAGVLPERRLPDLRKTLDLVALGTVADIAPLSGQNRILVSKGLIQLGEEQRQGIRALKEVAGLVGQPVSAGIVGFRLGPRINAVGRMGMAERGLKLLTTDDPLEARELSELLDRENHERQRIEREMYEQARAMLNLTSQEPVELAAVVLANEGWHQGVVGIVASKLAEELHVPVALISLKGGLGRGSARGIAALDLFAALDRSRELFEEFGGHTYAAGFSIKRENVALLARQFEQTVRSMLTSDDFIPRVHIDAEVSLAAVDDELVNALAKMAPFGVGNPEPLLAAMDARILNKAVVGGNHLKMLLDTDEGTIEAIAFGMGKLHERLRDRVHLAFNARHQVFNNRRSIVLNVRDLKVPGRDQL